MKNVFLDIVLLVINIIILTWLLFFTKSLTLLIIVGLLILPLNLWFHPIIERFFKGDR